METHYSVLKCDENASKAELKKQYKKLAIQVIKDQIYCQVRDEALGHKCGSETNFG